MILEPPQTAQIEKKTLCIEEQGVKLRLTVVDTPGNFFVSTLREKNNSYIFISGFGSSLSSGDCIRSCCEYVDEQFRAYFAEESGIIRKNIVDNRVHCCLYFIPSHCHRYI
jgi:septin family protein